MRWKWVVGCDGSPSSIAAMRWAAGVARRRNEELVALGAWHVPVAYSAAATKRSLDVDRMALSTAADAHVDAAISSAGARDVVAATLIVEDHPAPALLEAADDSSVIVVGRRGISELRHLVLGSVSRYVATHADVPVVVVPDSWESAALDRIVVGFDGSDHAKSALRWALDVAPVDTEVVACMAIEISTFLREEAARERYGKEIGEHEDRLAAAIDEVDPDGSTKRVVVVRDVRSVLADEAATADLLVVGARGRGAIGSALLGSVTTWSLHRVLCPVAVVP